MANAAGMIFESIWRDPDWRTLSRGAQALYMQLLSQKELDCAGILPLQPEKWAKGCAGLTVALVWADLEELQRARFVYYDTDTYEALIRTHVRNSNVPKVPNMRKSAIRSALLVGSERLREVLAVELRASGRADFVAAADEINPSPTLPEPLANPSKVNPSGTLPEPTGVGMGMGMGVTHLGNYSSGGERPKCARHPDGNQGDENCRGCKRCREWDERNAEANELDARRRAREIADNCPDCHGTNLIEIAEDTARKCEHPYATAAAHA